MTVRFRNHRLLLALLTGEVSGTISASEDLLMEEADPKP